MTRILTVSSGSATPKSECSPCAAQGFSGAVRIDMKGARISPSSEMLAAPRKKAVHTLAGGPGRSPAATTSHRMSSAGATAAVPMTVGRDSRTSIYWPYSNTHAPLRRAVLLQLEPKAHPQVQLFSRLGEQISHFQHSL